jgi:SAM-dependent methyltransferase
VLIESYHQFQRDMLDRYGVKPILNAACMGDTANLGKDYGAINTDIRTFDAHNGTDLTKLPNFCLCDVTSMHFGSGTFGTVVLGEFLEHCVVAEAVRSFQEVYRVLTKEGKLILTFPLDDRPKKGQHDDVLTVEWAEGITSWHQTVWEDEMLLTLFGETGFQILCKQHLDYGFARRGGWGIVLGKA